MQTVSLVIGPETEGTGRAGSERPCGGVRCPSFTSAPAALSPSCVVSELGSLAFQDLVIYLTSLETPFI